MKQTLIILIVFIHIVNIANAQRIRTPIPDNARSLGFGLMPGNWEPAPNKCLDILEESQVIGKYHVEAHFVKSFSEFSKSMVRASEAEVGAAGFGSAKIKSTRETFEKRTSNMVTLVLKGYYIHETKYVTSATINDNGASALESGVQVFVESFGSHYIESQTTGSISYVILQYESHSKELRDVLQNSGEASVSYNGMSASVKASVKKEIKSKRLDESCTTVRGDIGPSLFDLSGVDLLDVDAVLSVIRKGKPSSNEESSAPLFQELRSFSSLFVANTEQRNELKKVKKFWDKDQIKFYNSIQEHVDSLHIIVADCNARLNRFKVKQTGVREEYLESLRDGKKDVQAKIEKLLGILGNIEELDSIKTRPSFDFLNHASGEEKWMYNILNPVIDYELRGFSLEEGESETYYEGDLDLFTEAWRAQLNIFTDDHIYIKPPYSRTSELQFIKAAQVLIFGQNSGRQETSYWHKDTLPKRVFSINAKLKMDSVTELLLYNDFFLQNVDLCYVKDGKVFNVSKEYPGFLQGHNSVGFVNLDIGALTKVYLPIIYYRVNGLEAYALHYLAGEGKDTITITSITENKDTTVTHQYNMDWKDMIQLNYTNRTTPSYIPTVGIMRNMDLFPDFKSDEPFLYVEIKDVLGGKYYVPYFPINYLVFLKEHYPNGPFTLD
ncbi:MAG: hypothetical protein COB15_11915 [Flavobacteriales bacterium]|nr:MAG: hypothetical protein COB15_11915 [Flavobacteriales bacterium]